MKRKVKSKWVIVTILLALVFAMVAQGISIKALAASPAQLIPLKGHVPEVVAKRQAQVLHHHNSAEMLFLAVGLQLRNKKELAQFLRDASDPHSSRYGKYLTQAQANQLYNPTFQEEQQIVDWLRAGGLKVTHTYANHMLVDAEGTTTQIEHMLHLTINDYVLNSHGKQIVFYAPTNEPIVDSNLATIITSIAGLDDFPRFHMNTIDGKLLSHKSRPHTAIANNGPPYYPQDYANAYNVNPLWNTGETGVNQYIGITLWSVPPTDNTLQYFNTVTGSTVPLQQNKRLQVYQVDGGTTNPDTGEAGMDIEYAGGMAPDANIDYWEMATMQTSNGIQPTQQAMEDAINYAGTSGDYQITSSWGYCEPSTIDALTSALDNYLMTNTATGHTYFFSTGDTGSSCQGSNPTPQYPASSDYATGVGGTTLVVNSGKYKDTAAWSGSGGGFSVLFPRPWWQVDKGVPNTTKRGYPDVAADADPNTGAFVCYSNNITCGKYGGTSLASPMWAGMAADLNQYLQDNGQGRLGFMDPTLYWLANSPQAVPAYNDITAGSNGSYSAGVGWDAVTGIGTPKLYNIACNIAKVCVWNVVPSLNEGNSYNYLDGVTVLASNNAWAVGGYSSSPYDQTQIQHWNGTQWSIVSSQNGSYGGDLYGVSSDAANDVWAVGQDSGYALIEHWNGTQWSIVPNPEGDGSSSNGATLYGVVALSSSNVWAVGNYYVSSYGYQTLIEHWNGTQWSVVASPNPLPNTASYNQLSSIKAISATDIWAIGYYYTGNSKVTSFQTLTEHWDGTQWSVIASPNGGASNGTLASVSANSSTDVWAVGSYYKNPLSPNPLQQTLIEHWNGTQWTIIASPNVRLTPNQLTGVTAISSSNVWVVGSYLNPSTYVYNTLTESWNGTQWSLVPSPNLNNTNNQFNAVAAIPGSNVWAVGQYNSSSYYQPYNTLIEVH